MNADNLVVLNGRLVRDVEMRFANSGIAIANFTIAVNQSRKNENGEREADFINCVAFNKTAETIANYFKKGNMIGIVGEYRNNNYVKEDGTKVYRDNVVVDNFGFRESKKDNNDQRSTQQNNFKQDSIPGMDNRGFNTNQQSNAPFGDSKPIVIDDDSLPF